VDFDEDGNRDLWRSTPDAVGSVANYLKRHGWQAGQPVAVRMTASATADFKALDKCDYKPSLSVAEWREKGFTPAVEIAADTPAAVIKLEEAERNGYWMVFKNFYVITRYNRSSRYAMAVYDLSQEIKQGMVQ
jgi:membrane-bound lytic murein transglycosylase B